jgi:hypothetical protein
MPVWLIELFGARDLDHAFVLIALMTAPVWIGMIVFPRADWVRLVARPLLVAALYSLVLCVLLWQSYQAMALPVPITGAGYAAARNFSAHPITFLALFCNLQILNLALGTMMYQKATRHGFRASIELTLCWGLGALAVVPFALRLLVRGKSLQ